MYQECHYIRHQYPLVPRDELIRVRQFKAMATVACIRNMYFWQ